MSQFTEALEYVDATLDQATDSFTVPLLTACVPVIFSVSSHEPDGAQLVWSRTRAVSVCCQAITKATLTDEISLDTRLTAHDALCNLSAEPTHAEKLLNLADTFTDCLCVKLLRIALDRSDLCADRALDLLCNLSREHASRVWNQLHQDPTTTESPVFSLVSVLALGGGYSSVGCTMDGVASLLQNLSQMAAVRKSLAVASTRGGTPLLCRVCTLLTEEPLTERRRYALQGMLRNLCFDDMLHEALLDESIGLLPALILPLCGPEDEIDEEDMAKLPVAVQFVPGDPETCREPDISARVVLCESLLQLCSTPIGRDTLRRNNVYVVLRELHKWDQMPRGRLAAERVVDVLINDELIAADTRVLRDVEVPLEVSKRIEEADKVYLEEEDVPKD